MTHIASAYRRPNGLMIALMILGGIDWVLCVAIVLVAATGLAQSAHLSRSNMLGLAGVTTLIALGLIVAKVAEWIVRAFWAHRLVRNILVFQAFPISPLWAWAGFLVPVASLWMPAKTSLTLSAMPQGPNRRLELSCLAWAVTRWLTCPSGGYIAFCALAWTIRHGWRPEYTLLILLTFTVPGIFSAALGMLVTPWITRRQPKPDQIHHAEVFE